MNACADIIEPAVEPYAVPSTGQPAPTPEAANDERRPTLTLLGSIPLVTPAPIEDLPLGVRQRIDRAELRARAGLRGEASRMVLVIEADLGVTTQDRIDAMQPEDDFDMAIEAALKLALATIEVVDTPKPKRKKGKARKAAKLALPSMRTDEDLTEDQVRRLAAATAKLSSPDPDIRADGRDEIKEVEDWHRRRTEALARDREDTERRALEALRHGDDAVVEEEVEIGRWARNEEGFLELEKGKPIFEVVKAVRTRVTSRDGLESLLDSGAIDAIQHGAGMKYRDLYERALMDGRIKSLLADRSGSGPTMAMTVEEIFDIDNVVRELARAKRGVPVFDVEKRVRDRVQSAYGESMGALAVAVLRAIAGAGVTLYSLAPVGRANQRYSLAIKEALTAAADHFGLQ